MRPHIFKSIKYVTTKKAFIPVLIHLGVIKRKRWTNSPLLTEKRLATELFPYTTKTWEALSSLATTYYPFFSHQRQRKWNLRLEKLNTEKASENNNIVNSFAYYSIWIINFYFKVIHVFFCFVWEIFSRNTYYLKIFFYTSDTSRNITEKMKWTNPPPKWRWTNVQCNVRF